MVVLRCCCVGRVAVVPRREKRGAGPRCVDVEVQGARCQVPGARRSRELCTEGDLQSRWATATDAGETTGLGRGYAPGREGCGDELWWLWAMEAWEGLPAVEETGGSAEVEKRKWS